MYGFTANLDILYVWWEIVERLQEMYPYYHIGWDGFIPMFRGN